MTRWWLAGLVVLVGCAAGSSDDGAAADNSAVSSAATSATPEDFNHWQSVLAAQGITLSTARATVIGVRTANTRVAQVFDDRMVVLTKNQQAISFEASTHPWFERNAGAPDVDGDGLPDVGMLKPGSYHATRNGTHFGAPKFNVALANGSGSLRGWRNTNGDDRYEDSEIAASEKRGDLVTEILVHAAGPGSLPPIGCQVLAPADANALAALVGNDFDYVLIDAPSAD